MNKIRPIKVKLEDKFIVPEIIRKAKLLKNDDRFRRIFVEKDRSIEERTVLREMRIKMMESKRNNFYSIIRDGELICEPF